MKKQFLLLLWMTLLPLAGWAQNQEVVVSPRNASKLYGATDASIVAGLSLKFETEGTPLSDDQKSSIRAGLSISRVGENASENVGAYTFVIEYTGEGVEGLDIVTNGSAMLTIKPAPITIVAEVKSKTYGGSDPELTVEDFSTQLKNGDTAESIGFSISRAAGENAGTYTITPAITSTNYELTATTADFTINKAPLAISAVAASKTYGDADPTLEYSDFAEQLVNDDTAEGIGFSISRAGGEDVNTYTITPAITSTNYELTATTANFTINPKAINAEGVQIVPIADQEYTGAAIEPAIVVKDGDNVVDASNYDVAYDTSAGYNVGDVNSVTVTGKGNYLTNDENTLTATYNIVKKTLHVSAVAASKNYGEEDPVLTFTYTDADFISGESKSNLTAEPTISREEGETPGTYTISLSGGEADNYKFEFAPADFTINAATITITADNVEKYYGAEDPALTYSVAPEGLAQYITTAPTLTREEGEDADDYEITVSGGEAAVGYEIAYADTHGKFTINPAVVTITAENKSKVKGDEDPELTYTVTGLVGEDQLTTEPTLTRVLGETPNDYAITATDAEASSNYTIEYVAGTFTITKPTLIVRATSASKTYGDADPTLAYTASGFIGSDDFTTTPTVSRATGEDAGTYEITVSGGVANDYDIVYFPGTFTINPKTLTITADNASKDFGAADPDSYTVTYDGFADGEDESKLSGTLSVTRVEGETVGTYAITPSGLTSSNYDITFVNGTFTINAAGITITAESTTKSYGDADPEFTYTVSPIELADKVTSVKLERTEENQGEDVKAGGYTITASEAVVADGYNVSYVNGTLTITAKEITIKAEDKEKVLYDEDPEFTYEAVTLVGGDEFTTQPTFTRKAGETLGTYTITPSGADAGTNYTFNYVAGTLTIKKPTLTITIADKAKTYGEADPAFTYEVTGLKGSDALTTAPTLTREDGDDVGNYAITATGAVQANYDIEYVPGTLTINKAAAPQITALGQTIAYGGNVNTTPSATTISITGLQNGETIADNSLNITITVAEGATATLGDHANAILVTATSNNYEDATYVYGTLTVNQPAGLNFTSIDNDYNDILVNDGKTVNVTWRSGRSQVLADVNRTWAAEKWNVVVLPFNTSVKELSKAIGYAIVNVVDPDGTTEGNVKFKLTMGKLKANEPFVVKTTDRIPADSIINFGPQTIVAPDSEYPSVEAGLGYKFVGAYKTKEIDKSLSYLRFLLGSGDNWARISEESANKWNIIPFAGYVDLSVAGSRAANVTFTMEELDGTTTTIRSVDYTGNAAESDGWYNLNGIKMNNAPTKKGFYINNGKKVVIK